MLNRVMIIGRLGQDPQLKYSQAGMPIATFSVATDETFTDREGIRQQRTEWFRVVVFQKAAENCSRYIHKGSLVYVEGSLQTRKWQDPQGVERQIVEIRAQRVDFLERSRSQDDFQQRRSYGEGESYGGYDKQAYTAPQRPQQNYAQYEERTPVFPQDAMDEDKNPQNPAQDSPSSQSKMDEVPF